MTDLMNALGKKVKEKTMKKVFEISWEEPYDMHYTNDNDGTFQAFHCKVKELPSESEWCECNDGRVYAKHCLGCGYAIKPTPNSEAVPRGEGKKIEKIANYDKELGHYEYIDTDVRDKLNELIDDRNERR